MTFSIVGRDPDTGELGIAVQSKFLAVGAAVPWAKAGVGAIATQALSNLDYGEIGLSILSKGYSAMETLNALLSMDENREDRQIGIVDANGGSAAFTGKNCFNWAGHICGENFSCQGNILVGEDTVKALSETFKSMEGSLARRLMAALNAAQNAGGDRRGKQSAALLVVKSGGSYGGYNDRYIDLRVDDDPDPIKKLSELLKLHELYFNRTTPGEMVEVTRDVAASIQKSLRKLGYYDGEANGQFDAATKKAYDDFCGIENFEERMCKGNIVDRNVLDFLINKAGNI